MTYNPDTIGSAINLVSFGDAVIAAKQGKRISRTGWNSSGLFVFVQVPSTIPPEVVSRMSSLPESVKAEFAKRGGHISYSNQWALVKPDNTVNGWAPSAADALAEDWVILD